MCVRGTLTCIRVTPISSPLVLSLYLPSSRAAATAAATIAVAAAAAAPAPDAATILLPGASFPPLSPLPSFSLLVVDCCLPRRGLLLCFRHTR